MSFIDTQFPKSIAYGSAGGPEFNTEIVELDSGNEQSLIRWPVGRHRYDAAGGVKTQSDYASVQALFHVAKGKGHYWRWHDKRDYKTTTVMTAAISHTDCELVDSSGNAAVGDGSTTVFYLAKKYTAGGSSVYRPITLPVAGTVLIGVNGSLQTLTTDYTVDNTTGIVTFVTAPALNDVLTCGCEFDVPARFDTNYLPSRIVNKSAKEVVLDFDVPIVEFRR